MISVIDETNSETNSKNCLINPNQCEICQKVQFKYKCPRCNLKTCSLICCKKHKEDTGCTGQRDKTKFVSKENFDESLLMNDYRFLEEQSRVIDAYQRAAELGEEHILNGKTLSNPTIENDPYKNTTAYSFYENLRKFVYKQFNICLKLMPSQSTRHLNNKTRFNRNANMVSWSMEFLFHLDSTDLDKSQKYFRFDTKRVLFSSKETLKTTLKNFYDKFKTDLFDKTQFKYEQKDELKFKKLNYLHDQYKLFFDSLDDNKIDDFIVLYEISDFKEKKKYYIKFNLNKTLEELLSNRHMIEYPSLLIVKKENLKDYTIIEDDKEKEINLKNKNENDKNFVDDFPKSSHEKDDEINEFHKENELQEEEEGELEESDESGSEDEQNSSKKIRLENIDSNKNNQNDQNDDHKFVYNDSDELEEGEERD